MDNKRLKKQMDFILEMDKMKSIMRQTYLANGERKENDAEHSWHLALMCGILAEYSNEPIDVLKTMKMVLLHDAIEIDAGDTYAYDAAGNQTKKSGSKRRQTGYFRYSRKIWRKSTGTFGKNLKRAKPRRQNLPMCLTMHSQCF